MSAWEALLLGVKLALGLGEAKRIADGERIQASYRRALALDAEMRRLEEKDPELRRILQSRRSEG